MARLTMAELGTLIDQLFLDNVTRAISPADLREFCHNFVDTMTPAYGVLAIQGTSVQTFGTTDLYMGWESQYLAQVPEFSTNPGLGQVTRNEAGVNRILLNVDVELPSNRELTATLYANGVATVWRSKVSGNGTGRPEVLILEALHHSAAGPVNYDIRLQADANGVQVTFTNGVFLATVVPVRAD